MEKYGGIHDDEDVQHYGNNSTQQGPVAITLTVKPKLNDVPENVKVLDEFSKFHSNI